MHTALKFLNLAANGPMGNGDKVALKLDGNNEAHTSQTASDFLKIMGAMMELDPQKFQASLEQLDRIPLEGEQASESVPLIDLCGEKSAEHEMLAMLLDKRMSDDEDLDDLLEMDGSDRDEDALGAMSAIGSALADEAATQPIPQSALELKPDASAIVMPQPEPSTSESGPAMKTADLTPADRGSELRPKAPVIPTTAKVQEIPAAAKASEIPAAAKTPQITADAKAPQIGPMPSVEPKTQADLSAVKFNSAPGDSTAGQQTIAPEGGNAGPPIEKATPLPQAAKLVQNTEGNGGNTGKDAAPITAQFAAAGQPVKRPSLDRKPAPAADTATSAKPAVTAPVQSSSLPNVNQIMEQAVRVEADTARQNWQFVNPDSEQADGAQAKPDDGQTLPRAALAREGFQTALSRMSAFTARSAAEQALGDKPVVETTRDMQADVMRQIVQRMTLRTHGTQSKMQIQLKPEFLGNVHMQVSTDNQQVVVRMTAESMAVKEMIEQHLSFLKAELQQHGLQVDKFDVFVSSDSEGWKNSQDPSGFRQALKQGRQDQTGRRKRQASGADVETAEPQENKTSTSSNEIEIFA